MAELLVSALVRTLISTLTSSASLQEIALLWGFKDDLDNLESILTTLQLVLQDAEVKQRKSQPLQNWLRKLKDAAYEAENILDQMLIESLKRKFRGISFFTKRNPLIFRIKMAHKVKNIREKLSVIAKERLKFHLGEGVMESRYGVTLESRQTCSLVNEAAIYGREWEKEMMVEKLLDSAHDQDDLYVYAILGMGGLGKTTLAQLIYNHEKMDRSFDLRIWVCVSDDFNIQRLVRSILKSIDRSAGDISELDLDPLQRLLREKLGGRRFLLVLDDVWNENNMLWDGLKEILRCGSKGSILLVTTRIEKIATMMATNDLHRIGYLSEEDSWSLFKGRAFSTGDVDENLIPLGKAIVKRCGGVPLAIKALGSLMKFKSGEREWLAIKESEIWQLEDDESGILPALRLSYDNLLPHMRQCFAYCCLFPKDYEMEEEELIQLWMANGFIPSDDRGDLFLAGQLIFKELSWRSFFQDIKQKMFLRGRTRTTCQMHDLVHDLAVSVMEHEICFLEKGGAQQISKKIRHLSFDDNAVVFGSDSGSKIKLQTDHSLQSLLDLRKWRSQMKVSFSFLSNQSYIRAFKINYFPIENLASVVSKFEHLKLLSIACLWMERLPVRVNHLYNLQTLKLTESKDLIELPIDMKAMKNLWFLELDSCDSLRCTPPGLGELTRLRRLSVFVVGEGATQKLDQLKELNLGGELTIKGLHNVENFEAAKSANLEGKMDLTCLKLEWTENQRDNPSEHFENVLQGLQPHQNLEQISIAWYQGTKFPNWMSPLAFANMVEISLMHCERSEYLPSLGRLPSLRSLYLISMVSVKQLGGEWYGDVECSFPALTSLRIVDMLNLEEWHSPPDSTECFPCLTYLDICSCPKLELTQPLLDILGNISSLRTLDLSGCSKLEFLPEELGCLKSLETLTVGEYDALTTFSASILEDMPSLRTLEFSNCKKLEAFSGGALVGGTALQELRLHWLPEFECFPECMQQFHSLSSLWIWGCEKLKSVPDWFRDLKSLQRLRIQGCPELEKRCKRDDGEDWPKISHIPKIYGLSGFGYNVVSHLPIYEDNNEAWTRRR